MCLFTSARTVAIVFARSAGSEAMYCSGVLTFDAGFMDWSSFYDQGKVVNRNPAFLSRGPKTVPDVGTVFSFMVNGQTQTAAFYTFSRLAGKSVRGGRAISKTAHQGITSRSRQNGPVLFWGASAAAQTMPAAPSSTERGAAGPPISVRHQPGETEFTATPLSLSAAASRQVIAFSVVFDAE